MSESLFYTLIWVWIIVAIVIVPVQLKVTAPYGRHTKSSWGPLIPNKLGWMLMEFPSLFLFSFFFLTGPNEQTPVTWLFFGLYVLHYVNRTFIFPLRTRTNGKKMPLAITFSAIFFNLINGSINGYFLGTIADVQSMYSVSYFTDPRFLIGLGLFVLGMGINWQSDNILLNLRKPGETGYKIPKGGFFKWVSCPNHFGELIEWIGFAVMLWALPAVAFAIWTAANLIPRALDHHKWYKQKFEEYPKERKAVIPKVL